MLLNVWLKSHQMILSIHTIDVQIFILKNIFKPFIGGLIFFFKFIHTLFLFYTNIIPL